MEVCKYEPHSTDYKRPNQNAQAWTSHPTRSNPARSLAYKLARLFTQKIKQLAPLPNRHNSDNTRDVIKKLNDTPILPHFTLASLDITNLYTNIPVAETRNIIPITLKENLLDPTRIVKLVWRHHPTKLLHNKRWNPDEEKRTGHERANIRPNIWVFSTKLRTPSFSTPIKQA